MAEIWLTHSHAEDDTDIVNIFTGLAFGIRPDRTQDEQGATLPCRESDEWCVMRFEGYFVEDDEVVRGCAIASGLTYVQAEILLARIASEVHVESVSSIVNLLR